MSTDECEHWARVLCRDLASSPLSPPVSSPRGSEPVTRQCLAAPRVWSLGISPVLPPRCRGKGRAGGVCHVHGLKFRCGGSHRTTKSELSPSPPTTHELLSGLFPCLFPAQKPCAPRAQADDHETHRGCGAVPAGVGAAAEAGVPRVWESGSGGPRCGNEDGQASGGPSHLRTMAKACEHVDGSRARSVLPELSWGSPGPPARNTAGAGTHRLQ